MSDKDERLVFAKNLRELMNVKGVSQQKIAEVVGVSESSVSLWLSANRYPSPGKVQMVADFLGVRKSQLIDDPKDYKPLSRIDGVAAKLERLTENQLSIIEQLVDNFLNGGVNE